jgi:hypothetical protein
MALEIIILSLISQVTQFFHSFVESMSKMMMIVIMIIMRHKCKTGTVLGGTGWRE